MPEIKTPEEPPWELEPVDPTKALSVRHTLQDLPGNTDAGSKRALDKTQATQLIAWAKDNRLDAWRGHVVMMYGRPYVTLEGWLYLVRRDPRFKGWKSATLTLEERRAEGYGEGDVVVRVTVKVSDLEEPVEELGVVSGIERLESRWQIEDNVRQQAEAEAAGRDHGGKPVEGWRQNKAKEVLADEKHFHREVERRMNTMPIHRNPRGQAEVRGLRMCLRRAFPLGLPLQGEAEAQEGGKL